MARKKAAKKKPAARKTTKKKTTAKRKTTKSRAKKSSSAESLYVASKVKAEIKKSGLNMASDALEGLNKQIYWLIEQATTRTTCNGRKTVRAHDFLA